MPLCVYTAAAGRQLSINYDFQYHKGDEISFSTKIFIFTLARDKTIRRCKREEKGKMQNGLICLAARLQFNIHRLKVPHEYIKAFCNCSKNSRSCIRLTFQIFFYYAGNRCVKGMLYYEARTPQFGCTNVLWEQLLRMKYGKIHIYYESKVSILAHPVRKWGFLLSQIVG